MQHAVVVAICFAFVCYISNSAVLSSPENDLKESLLGDDFSRPQTRKQGQSSDLFVYSGSALDLFSLWKTVEVVVNFTAKEDLDYGLYHDSNKSALLDRVNREGQWFGLARRFAHWRSVWLPPFQRTFVAVVTPQPYKIRLKIIPIDVKLALTFLVGLILFFNAARFARNVSFYYASGVSVGLLGSVLVLVFILFRFIPKRPVGLSVLVGGWSLGFFFLYKIWLNIASILVDHYRLVALYVVTVCVISFGFLYWYGPPSKRSLDLSQWALQAIACLCVFLGSQIPEVSAVVVFLMVVVYNIPQRRVQRFVSWFRWRFLPAPKRRLMTEDEYTQQGVEETKRALEELRVYCRSPKCSPWKVLSKLKTPNEFAHFIEGGEHISENELEAYDSESDALELQRRRRRPPSDDDSDSTSSDSDAPDDGDLTDDLEDGERTQPGVSTGRYASFTAPAVERLTPAKRLNRTFAAAEPMRPPVNLSGTDDDDDERGRPPVPAFADTKKRRHALPRR